MISQSRMLWGSICLAILLVLSCVALAWHRLLLIEARNLLAETFMDALAAEALLDRNQSAQATVVLSRSRCAIIQYAAIRNVRHSALAVVVHEPSERHMPQLASGPSFTLAEYLEMTVLGPGSWATMERSLYENWRQRRERWEPWFPLDIKNQRRSLSAVNSDISTNSTP